MATSTHALEGYDSAVRDSNPSTVVDPDAPRVPEETGDEANLATERMSAKDDSDEDEVDRRDLAPPPDPAKAAAVRRLEEELAKHLPELVARLLSRAIVDPAKARRELQTPSTVRVMGGAALEVIRVDLYAHTVVPSPANPRDSSDRRLPIEDAESGALPPPQPLAGSTSVMVIDASDPEQMAQSLNRSQANLLATNSYVSDIEADGVLVPVTVLPMLVRHQDGSPEIAILATVDGSSRMASCHNLLGIQTSEAAYAYGRDPRLMLGFLGELAAAVRRVQAGADEEEPKVNALVVPAQVVIGHSGKDLRRAIQGYLGLQHVSHPKEWTDAGEIEAKADAILLELRDDGVQEPAIAWYHGDLSAADARKLGLPASFDERSVELLYTVMTRRRVAARGLRRVDRETHRVRVPKLAEVCADLALRPARASFQRGRADVARKELQELYSKTMKLEWAYTRRRPEALRDQALKEVGRTTAGPAGVELALLAAYWLVSKGTLKTLYYNQRLEENGKPDRRGVDQIIIGMLGSERGVHQLYQVVEDSRAGLGKPRLVDAGGEVMFGGNGLPVELTNDRVRIDLVPNPNTGEPEPMPLPTGMTPETQLQTQQTDVYKLAKRLRHVLDEIKDAHSATSTLVEERGWPAASAQEIMEDLDDVRTEIAHWKRIAVSRRTAAVTVEVSTTDGEDSDGLDPSRDSAAGQ